MGLKSGADPMHNMTIQMKFDNALQAVDFAKQHRTKYDVDALNFWQAKSDGATYQDTFLSKIIADFFWSGYEGKLVPNFRLIPNVDFLPIYVGSFTTLYIN